MKFFIWFFCLLFITGYAQAQMQPGRLVLGAEINQLNYQNTSMGRNTTSKVLATPSIGYFIAKNLVISLGVPLGIVRSSSNLGPTYGSYKENQTRIGLSPSIRYYLGESNLKPFVSFSYGYLINQNKYELIDKYQGNDRSNLFIPSIGLAYSLSQRLVLTTSINYVIDNTDSKNLVIPVGNMVADIARPDTKSLSVGLGIQVLLGR